MRFIILKRKWCVKFRGKMFSGNKKFHLRTSKKLILENFLPTNLIIHIQRQMFMQEDWMGSGATLIMMFLKLKDKSAKEFVLLWKNRWCHAQFRQFAKRILNLVLKVVHILTVLEKSMVPPQQSYIMNSMILKTYIWRFQQMNVSFLILRVLNLSKFFLLLLNAIWDSNTYLVFTFITIFCFNI